jgi:hypothetical protein
LCSQVFGSVVYFKKPRPGPGRRRIPAMTNKSKTTAWSFAVEPMAQGVTPPGAVKADFPAVMGLASSNQGKLTSSGSGAPPSRSGRRRNRSSEGLQCNFSCFLGFSVRSKLL